MFCTEVNPFADPIIAMGWTVDANAARRHSLGSDHASDYCLERQSFCRLVNRDGECCDPRYSGSEVSEDLPT